MREILFRAKRIDNGEWVEGNIIYSTDAAEGYEAIIIPIEKSNMYADEHDKNIGFEKWYKVNPETLCQYTGMKDKNGKRIWEKDIISINTYSYMEPEEDYFGQVVYAEGWACWCIQHPDDERPIPLCECEGSYQTDRFIGGNIFDNPELLGQDGV